MVIEVKWTETIPHCPNDFFIWVHLCRLFASPRGSGYSTKRFCAIKKKLPRNYQHAVSEELCHTCLMWHINPIIAHITKLGTSVRNWFKNKLWTKERTNIMKLLWFLVIDVQQKMKIINLCSNQKQGRVNMSMVDQQLKIIHHCEQLQSGSC